MASLSRDVELRAMFTFDLPDAGLGPSTVALPYASAILDVHGAVLAWNPAAELLLGWSTADAVGKSIEQVTGWGNFGDIGRELGVGATPRIVTELRRQDGAAFLAELAFSCLRDAAEEITGVLLLATDVTPRTIEAESWIATERIRTETRKISRVGSWDWDVISDDVTWSAEHYLIWGLDPSTSVPDRDFRRVHEDDREFFMAGVQRSLDNGEPLNLVARIRRPDGEIRWVESVAATFLVDGKVARLVGTCRDVTSRELSQASQRASEARYKLIVETAREGIWLVDASGVTIFANEQLADILGRPVDELLGMPVMDLFSADGKSLAAESFAVLAEGQPNRFEFGFERPDGTAIWTLLSAAPIFEDGRLTGSLAMVTDITERHQAELELQFSRERLAEAQKLALLGSWALDLASGVVTCSGPLYELLGVDPEVGLRTADRFLELVHPEDRDRGDQFLQRMTAGIEQIGEELRMITPAGNVLWVALRAAPVPGPAGQVVEMHGTLQDVSERKAAEEQLAYLALHDGLTGLPNRSVFSDRLDHALAARTPTGAAVLLLDLDAFKSINDDFGHAAGDALLITVADRLTSALRPVDTIARFGGDEFAVLLDDSTDARAVETAERLLGALLPAMQLDSRNVSVRASIGVAVASKGSETADEVIRKAEAAMHSAKGQGGGRAEVFNAAMYAADVDRMSLERDLRDVGLGAEMTLHYQPLVDLRDGRLSGFEALLRWNHPGRGIVMPDEFIPIAEASGAIVPIGRWVLTEACRQLSAWRLEAGSSPLLCMNVNVSARQLADGHLVEDVAQALDISALDPGLLTLEITETMILADEDDVGRRLGELKGLGVRISVDDFGTGYSSIGHLERFPVDELKIDRSFVANLGRDGKDSGVALGVLRLARGLHLDVVAEGIERVEQLAELRRASCTTGQGFYFAEPLDPAAIEGLLRQGSHYPMPESPPLILLVDDEVTVRVSAARILRNAGYEVVEATTGSDAIQIAQARRLDAAILDVGLPDMTGFEVAARLSEMSRGGLPIFIVSGTAVDVDDRVRGLNLGAEAYLTKPVAPHELIAVVAASLRSRGAAPTNAALHTQRHPGGITGSISIDPPMSEVLSLPS